MFSRKTSSGRGAQARQAELSSPAKASFPKKEPFEATVAGPARPPRSRQAGSGALPHGTRGRFTHRLALAASHTPCVHTPRALCVPTSAVYTQIPRAPNRPQAPEARPSHSACHQDGVRLAPRLPSLAGVLCLPVLFSDAAASSAIFK